MENGIDTSVAISTTGTLLRTFILVQIVFTHTDIV